MDIGPKFMYFLGFNLDDPNDQELLRSLAFDDEEIEKQTDSILSSLENGSDWGSNDEEEIETVEETRIIERTGVDREIVELVEFPEVS